MLDRFHGLVVRVFLAVLLCAAGFAHAANNSYWQDAAQVPMPARLGAPAKSRALELDLAALHADLARQSGPGVTMSLPRPEGGFDDFILVDSGTMPAELAAKYPQIRSYRGADQAGRHVRVDISPLGVNAMVFAHDGIWLVRPVAYGQGRDYIVVRRSDVAAAAPLRCDVPGQASTPGLAAPGRTSLQPTATGEIKRDYRAAVVANHQWVQAFTANASNPSVAEGLAGVVLAVNRVNEVYGNDFAIHLTLVANNDALIFPLAINGGVNDPFGDNSTNNGNTLSLLTSRISSIIGNGNYDIGHVFTTGSGGVAYLGVVCRAGSKGAGTTGLPQGALLSTDVFYIDFVAHEMGHQFGANHTFNGTQGNCGGGNRNGATGYEPGSGSTIMAYAGICGASNNLQPHSDPYFHAANLDEIDAYTGAGTGATCGTTEANHAPPTVAPVADYTIPAGTPFVLTGATVSASPGASPTYGWEEYDLGAPNNLLDTDPGTGPIIRSFNPAGPTRFVPRLAELFTGTHPFGEILPTTDRILNFVETVRDNVADGGTSQSAGSVVTVTTAAGPFTVTEPLAGAEWDYVDGTALVTWDVAGTDQPPISCPLVDIDLTRSASFDGTFILATGVANNGSVLVEIPDIATSNARVRVACANNIFFNISSGDFTIIPSDLIFSDGFDMNNDLIFADGFELNP